VQAIRLQECEDPLLTATLHAMDRHAIYRLEDPENGKVYEASGSELTDEGVAFRLEKRQGQIWTYRKLEP